MDNQQQIIHPLQMWGVGDIIFTTTLVRAFNLPVVWVVASQFLDGLQRAYPDIHFTCDKPDGYDDMRQEDYTVGNNRFIPLRWADSILRLPYKDCMRSKYDLYNIDYRRWKENAMFTRDARKESLLIAKLQIEKFEKYNLINTHFRSDNTGNVRIHAGNGLRDVYMDNISGFSLFDWAGIIENATEIHTVSTSIFYILELMELSQPINLYPRVPDELDFRNIDYIFTKPYILH